MRDRGFDLAHTSTNGMNEDCLKHVIRGGRSKNLEFLGRVRPQRLLAKLNPEHIGKLQKQACVAVVKAEYIGEQAVIGLRTSTKTFIAEGFASHNTEEYGPQKDGCLALIHVAKSLGIRIALPPESDLIRPAPLYGYQEHTPLYVKLEERRKELAARIMDAAHRRQAAHDEFTFLTGAQDNVGYIMKTWVSDDQAIAMMYGQPDQLQIEHVIDASPVEAKPRKKGWPKGKKRTKPAKAAKAKKTVAQELVAAAEPKKRGWPKGKPRGPKLPSAVKLQAALA
jgi:hypothetical protein